MSWPVVLANSAVPLVGLTETAVIGRHGRIEELGAIALGSLVFSFVYWAFGFLRMGTSGFAAQAAGAGEEPEVRAAFGRALLLGIALGLMLVLGQWLIARVAFGLLHGSARVEDIAADFFAIRIWGAPAALGTFATVGLLVGLGETRKLLWVQLVLNGLNAGLDLLFAGAFGWGARGIALGTLAAEWLAFGYALSLTRQLLLARHQDAEPFFPLLRMRDLTSLAVTLRANADIMLRTLLLVFGFAWFTDRSARFGDVVLAANHVLLQFMAFSSFFLDAFAFSAESLVGRACGARDVAAFDAAVRASTELAVVTALALAAGCLAGGPFVVSMLTDLEEVRLTARELMPFLAAYIALAVWAFQLDGIFIGATRTRDMRNAALLAVVAYLLISWPLIERHGNAGSWVAFIAYVVARAFTLGARFFALRASLRGQPAP